MKMDPAYIKKVQEWVECDNKILKHKQEIKVHQEKKQLIEDDILEYVETKKLDKLTLNISDGTIKFGKKSSTQALSMKLLRTALESYAQQIDIDALISHIQSTLETKQKVYMNRHVSTP